MNEKKEKQSQDERQLANVVDDVAAELDAGSEGALEEALADSEERFRKLLSNIEDVVFSTDGSGNVEFMSPAVKRVYGFEPDEVVGRHFSDFVHPEDLPGLIESFARTLSGKVEPLEFRGLDKTGRVHYMRSKSRVRMEEGVPVGVDGVLIDLTELEEEKARARAIHDHNPVSTFVWKRQGSSFLLADFNRAAKIATKGEVEGYVAKAPGDLHGAVPHLEEDLERCFKDKAAIRREVHCRFPGTRRDRRMLLTYGYIPSDMVIVHAEDVTDARGMEEQLVLSQRLEAVGRLAGGVAHDFNNLLSVIISYADFAIDELMDSDPIHADIVEIREAGRRAAALTGQLLAFSRKQILEPEVMSLNKVVSGIESMLRRLLGEDIDIAIRLDDSLGSAMADPGQIEQVLMNLAVNARDAMPEGGSLTIETRNVELDERYAEKHVSAVPGRFVMLSVTDNGQGMDADTREHIFEPFFTTKEEGKGTGLGLPTVYGIVKQSGGWIWAYSEPGLGTTFKVYLPRVDAPAAETTDRFEGEPVRGHETVLVVEDEAAVRRLAERILRSSGYRVLSAANGGEALLLCEQHGDEVDLLLTDVVMPKMSGKELADRLEKVCPGLRVLYMSGYTDDAIVRHGVLEQGVHFVGKPFAGAELTRKVREALD